MAFENSRPTFNRFEADYMQALLSNLENDCTGQDVNNIDYSDNNFRALRVSVLKMGRGTLNILHISFNTENTENTEHCHTKRMFDVKTGMRAG